MKLEGKAQHDLAKAVAREINWTTKRPEHWGDPETAPLNLVAPDGMEFWINTQWDDSERVNIHAEWPRNEKGEDLKPYNESTPSITVALKRGTAAIAKEISRRLAPEFQPKYKAAMERKDGHSKYLSGLREKTKRLADVLGDIARPATNCNRELEDGKLTLHGVNVWGSFDVSNDNTARIELHNVPLEITFEIAQLIKDKAKRKQ